MKKNLPVINSTSMNFYFLLLFKGISLKLNLSWSFGRPENFLGAPYMAKLCEIQMVGRCSYYNIDNFCYHNMTQSMSISHFKNTNIYTYIIEFIYNGKSQAPHL